MTSRQRSETDAAFGERIIELTHRLAEISESPDALTVTYLTPAHRAVAAKLRDWMQAAGMRVEMDALGNLIGRYAGSDPKAKTLIVASHYDTVVNAGKYDGRLGLLTPLVLIEHLQRSGKRLPFNIELIAFSEEEGQRFPAAFIGSAALTGKFDPTMLETRDAAGLRLGDVMREAGLDPDEIPKLTRRSQDLLGYLEVHIEQGPVLLNEGLPLGVVTSITGPLRYEVTITGEAGHAGTVPMAMRRDAATAAAEILLYVDQRCRAVPGLVGTVGKLGVPGGAINIIPGRCEFSIDIRAADDSVRDAAGAEIVAEIARIAARRNIRAETKEILRMASVRCSPRLQELLSDAIARAGIKPYRLASGAGHDAMMFDGITDLAMLFVRCGNGGVSHNPRETVSAEDADLGARVLLDAIMNFPHAAR
jgi:beta-ureidopropionase / N-carbamoyl-L-amino-acid hydrolase